MDCPEEDPLAAGAEEEGAEDEPEALEPEEPSDFAAGCDWLEVDPEAAGVEDELLFAWPEVDPEAAGVEDELLCDWPEDDPDAAGLEDFDWPEVDPPVAAEPVVTSPLTPSAARVSLLSSPLASIPLDCWNSFNAACVFGPITPSAWTWWPDCDSFCCACFTMSELCDCWVAPLAALEDFLLLCWPAVEPLAEAPEDFCADWPLVEPPAAALPEDDFSVEDWPLVEPPAAAPPEDDFSVEDWPALDAPAALEGCCADWLEVEPWALCEVALWPLLWDCFCLSSPAAIAPSENSAALVAATIVRIFMPELLFRIVEKKVFVPGKEAGFAPATAFLTAWDCRWASRAQHGRKWCRRCLY